jgi:hypothetical protein
MAYFSNGTEGMVFDDQCSICKYGDKPCPIAAIQAEFNYSQHDSGTSRKIMTALVSQSGECCMFKEFKSDFEIDTSCEQQELNLD